MILSILDQTLALLPEKAVLLPDHTLVAADIHLGKATAFQAKGLAIPEGDSDADLNRLRILCEQVRATRVVINGDLFHSPAGLTKEIERLLETWLFTIGIPVELVIGNHDRKLPRLPDCLTVLPFAEHAGIHLVHDPADAPDDRPVVAAHWHPVARIADGRRTSLRLPCFLLRRNVLVLPSFGSFTGGAIIDRQDDDRMFVAPGDRVIEVPGKLLR
ncbi:ligase-associated DNA damage response endonuclease PdeM [Luteolibacter flavescens]|uniref:Ligase-associated DNA damage response endonuclease PdeM n=1 Tax=Luteolibacter flavescens TaxID=1859460 RepID=A0ABT3FS88_9BACT|nr:ligase-associated DNA damage response endonuclease PdeM [Luteolibacter flavescens]MCW1886449.1 ligase-associated DNA damage response endonuclease PdeM [Luteolibacter flavescens]